MIVTLFSWPPAWNVRAFLQKHARTRPRRPGSRDGSTRALVSVLTLLLAGIDTLRISSHEMSQLVQCLACQSLCWNKASHCGLSQCGFENGAPLRPRSRRISKFDVRTQRSEEYHATFLFEVFILVHFDAYVSELGKVPVNHCLSPTTWTSKPLAYLSVLRSSWYSSSWRIPFLWTNVKGGNRLHWVGYKLLLARARPRGQFVGAASSRRNGVENTSEVEEGLGRIAAVTFHVPYMRFASMHMHLWALAA